MLFFTLLKHGGFVKFCAGVKIAQLFQITIIWKNPQDAGDIAKLDGNAEPNTNAIKVYVVAKATSKVE